MPAHSERTTASEHAYDQIKRMIANHRLPPGTPLVAQTLANTFGMSRTPIIEALRRLERDGLVVTSPRWGTSVREWTWKEIYESYRIRRALEGEAAYLFVLHAGAEAKKRLKELGEALVEAADDPVRMSELDLQLHLHVARAGGFERLYELVESSKVATNVIGYALIGIPSEEDQDPVKMKERCRREAAAHRPLVDALLGSDADEAARAMQEHIDDYSGRIMRLAEAETQKSHGPLTGSAEQVAIKWSDKSKAHRKISLG